MRAAYFLGPRDIVIKQTKRPKPQNGWAVVKVRAAGICGSDLHLWRGEITPPSLPIILGHEFAGELYSADTETLAKYGLERGDRVAIEPLVECGKCEFCTKGLYNLCPNLRFIGYHYNGGFAEYALVPARKLYKIPKDMDFNHAALLDPLAVPIHAINLLPHDSVSSLAVIGDGMIGLITIWAAKEKLNPEKILIIGKHDYNLKVGLSLGADIVININDKEQIKKEYNGWDCVFEAVGGSSTAFEYALNLVKPGGSIISLGIHPQRISLSLGILVSKQIYLLGSNGYSTSKGERDFQGAIGLMREGKLNIESLVTHILPLDEIADGFRMLENKEQSKAIKIVIKPNL